MSSTYRLGLIVELREIETFLVLAEELHFGKTAARLHLTQGRVSQTIRALEREVGAALFERTSRSVRLTPLGARFRTGAQRGFDELHRTLRECRSAARAIGSELRVGYMASIGGELVTRIVTTFEETYPDCTVTLSALVNFEQFAKGYEADAGHGLDLVWSPGGDGTALGAPGRTVGPVLHRTPRGVLVPGDHPLAACESISVEDLAGYELLNPSNAWRPELLDAWTPKFTPSGKALNRTAIDVPTMTGRSQLVVEDVQTLVARGRGLHCTVASLLARSRFPGLAVVPIRDLPPMVVVPVWRAAAEDAAIRAFVEIALSFSEGNRRMSD